MEELIIRLLFVAIMLLGVLGNILPVLPGAPLIFGALLVAKLLGYSGMGWGLIIVFGILTLLGVLLDFLIPVATTKKMGGSRYGIAGLVLGFLVGIIFAPFGFFSIIIAPFLGALIGELIYDSKDSRRAVKAATGSVLGYFISLGYGLILSLGMLGFYVINEVVRFF